ncbi:hypothetical protein MXD59_17725, partial [Frankia sp. Ag45/Mut15]|nr:hypothetical protein [Frankia umida]
MTGHSGRRGTLVLVALVVVLVNGAAVVLVQRGLPTGPDGHPAPPGRGVPVPPPAGGPPAPPPPSGCLVALGGQRRGEVVPEALQGGPGE